MRKTIKENQGITLIALVITIIVLLILAGVTLASLNGESSIFTRANEAVKATEFATVREELAISYSAAYAENLAVVQVDRKPTNLKDTISESIKPILERYAEQNNQKKSAIVVEPTSELTWTGDVSDTNGATAKIKLTYKADQSYQEGTITVKKVRSTSDTTTYVEEASFEWGSITSNNSGSSPSSDPDPTPVTTYTITYNANGGSGSMSSQTKNTGESVTIQSNGFTAPSGKIFAKWSTNTTGTDTYTPGSTYSTDSDLTLYAIWSDNICCFAEGTLVYTESGLKPIEQIHVGENVWTINEETFEKELKEVTQTFAVNRINIYEIVVGNEKITCTYDHKFYVYGRGWTECQNLKIGDNLVDIDGKQLEIQDIKAWDKNSIIPVYNIGVNDNHNYLVSSLFILAHNAGCPTTGSGGKN